MKEATSELNVTVIVVISVGILMAFFFTVFWPMLDNNFERESNCKKATCDCKYALQNDNKCTCWVGENKDNTFLCPFGG